MTGKADLSTEIEKVRQTQSVAWTHIISLRREDAHRLDFENADVWRKAVAANAGKIAKLYNIDMKNLNLLGAFHNEGHHPHIHLFVYSNDKNEGVIPKKQMEATGERMRSMFTNSIFREDMEPLVTHRNALRAEMGERVKAVSSFYGKKYEANPNIAASLVKLSEELPSKGKLQYAYLEPQIKDKVNNALRQIIGSDSGLSNIVEEYFALQYSLIEQYNDDSEKVEAKYIDFVQHFYEPRTGKYADKRDMTTLHNIVLQCATAVKNDARARVHVGAGKTVNIVSSEGGLNLKAEALPVETAEVSVESAANKKAAGCIEVVKEVVPKEKPEVLPVCDAAFRLYDAAGNLLSEKKTETDGRAVFTGLQEGTYTVEDTQAASHSTQANTIAMQYATVTVARLIASELVALCDTVEVCSRPQKSDKSRKRGQLKEHRKNYGIREGVRR